MLITRRHVRDEVTTELVEWIISGRLPENKPVGEEAIASELGISRTPLREALIALERDGLVKAQHSRGFVVNPLSAEEVREVYPIMWGLEATAMELAAAGPGFDVSELKRLNKRFLAAATAHERLESDMAWHHALLTRSGNTRLVQLAERIKNIVRRYELAYMIGLDRRSKSGREHAAIADALSGGNTRSAIRQIRLHWREGMERVDQMLRDRHR